MSRSRERREVLKKEGALWTPSVKPAL